MRPGAAVGTDRVLVADGDRPREGDAPGAPEGREFAAAPAGRPSPAAEMEDNDPFADD